MEKKFISNKHCVSYNTVSKVLQSNCKQTHKKYIPARSMWLHRVFTDLANTNKRHCLTIDCSGVNKNGPGRYRTQTDNLDKQVCYFNKTCDDDFYVFISDRINSGTFDKGIYFQITQVRDNNKTFDTEKTLEDGATDDRLSKTDFDSELEFAGRGVRKRRAKELSESNESRVIIQDYYDVQPKKIKHSSTKVKTRNLLTNISYRWYSLKDEKRSFYIDLFSYILLNLNPIGLDRKLDSDFERNQLKMIWDVCVPRSFTKYIFKEDNFT